ncbi:transcriptional regulator, LuxR family [Shewanella halifaxensis HAW-EB4]|uniref:Transcriptional regulator, LuxR family n=1 Tax=Shewanella halifaxensis (strain HAW-EB4) TaxID=458817 RepID=B0TMP2_SHEHH|nr:LuxR C-terminal-related transcriptional regulator [Shewanella halifaxensis]ABZ77402.1 transcriptional regulator, LuxR family [Shewanella halifaxensis HAW-EB4]
MKNLSSYESVLNCPDNPLDDMRQTFVNYGFSGFWFQGIANNAYLDYQNGSPNSLLTRRMLLSCDGVIASSLTVKKLHEQYVTRIAPTDLNFAEALKLDSPYCYILNEPCKVKKLFSRHGVNTVISWPLKHFASNVWSGRFTLLSKQSNEAIDLTGLEISLKQAQMILLEHFYSEITPFRQHKLFNKTAMRILEMAALGLQNDEIAHELDITIRGVEYHFESMRSKLSATNRANLVHIAHQLEII